MVRARVSTPWKEFIVWKLLEEMRKKWHSVTVSYPINIDNLHLCSYIREKYDIFVYSGQLCTHTLMLTSNQVQRFIRDLRTFAYTSSEKYLLYSEMHACIDFSYYFFLEIFFYNDLQYSTLDN